tara:strand:+ start:156 stop:278 length:123 start_codon:yes stop_codon:yes gene_type:complete
MPPGAVIYKLKAVCCVVDEFVSDDVISNSVVADVSRLLTI